MGGAPRASTPEQQAEQEGQAEARVTRAAHDGTDQGADACTEPADDTSTVDELDLQTGAREGVRGGTERARPARQGLPHDARVGDVRAERGTPSLTDDHDLGAVELDPQAPLDVRRPRRGRLRRAPHRQRRPGSDVVTRSVPFSFQVARGDPGSVSRGTSTTSSSNR